MKDLVILGASTAFLEILSIIQDINTVQPQYRVVAILDDNPDIKGSTIEGVPIAGSLKDVSLFPKASFIFGIAAYKMRHKRLSLLKRIGLPDERYETLVHPRAKICPTATVGAGSILNAGVMVCPGARLDPFVIVGPNAVIGGAHIMRGAVVGALASVLTRCRIGPATFVAIGSIVYEGISVGPGALVGIGSVVFADVPAGTTVIGNPAHFISQSDVPLDLVDLWEKAQKS